MCTQPIYIRNPYKDRKKLISYQGSVYTAPSVLYSHEDKIQVPCGKCAECRNTYFQSIFQRAVVESMSSYMYFVTLTYDNKHIPSVNVGGTTFYYADYTHIQLMIKRLRNNNIIYDREWRYLCVNEYGDSKLRPHFHLIFFVSKLDTDDPLTPYTIEHLLFKNIAPNFSKNVGSKKRPKYEQLFTYRTSWRNGEFRSNYFVKYVDLGYRNTMTETTYKTINYLIGYVNKPQKVDKLLDKILSSYSDPLFVQRVRSKLRSQVRYSKGFGCGFVDGVKNSLPVVCSSLSESQQLYTELKQNLPKDFETFYTNYHDLYLSVVEFFDTFNFNLYTDFGELYRNIDSHGLICLFVAHIYKLSCLSKLKCLTSQRLTPTLRYFFEFNKPYSHSYNVCKTDCIDTTNPVVAYIRKGLDDGLRCSVPFLPFVYGDKFQPLCNFYKRTCTIPSDVQRMYKSVGVSNFDQWLALFNNYVNNKKAVKQLKNEFKHAKKSENICISQKLVLDLQCEQHNIYRFTLK